MATESVSPLKLSGLGKRLVAEDLLDESAAREASEEATRKGRSLLAYLQQQNQVPAEALARAAAHEFGFPLVDLSALDLSGAPTDHVKDSLLQRHQAVPVARRGNCPYIALADPSKQGALDEIAFNANLLVEPLLAPANQIESALERAMEGAAAAFEEFAGAEDEEGLDELGFDTEDDEADESPDLQAISEDKPIVRFVNKVLVDAIRRGASDIHFEPYEDRYRIRLRLDGVLKSVLSPPPKMAPRLSSRLKVMSGLDIAERRIPQDGRIKLNLGRGKTIDFRVSTCPTLFGEKVVLRILDPAVAKVGIEKLGFEPAQQQHFEAAIKKPYGMILVTGPTGSGKTVTLYSGMHMLNEEGRNISTVEDPVEIRVPGINQVQQNEKKGMTFARALRSFLRQDPDIIMVGEIRDLETAEIAIKAAQTGHLVLSTLHTNDAPQSITRLVNMGIPTYNVVSAVNLVMAQRLARRLHDCKQQEDMPEDALRQVGFTEEEIKQGLDLYQPGGCQGCNDGYKGRGGVFQVMPISKPMERIILEGANALDLAKQAEEEAINDLRRSALNKVKEGTTSLLEMSRVTKE